jgi:hypothetical protein
MIAEPEIDLMFPLTDGNIAINNLESACRHSWSRFWREPLRPGIAESVVEQEQFTQQFLGDLTALDRLQALANQLDHEDANSPRTALIHAQIASMAHRFADARSFLAKAAGSTELADLANCLSLSIDQACGTRLEAVLEARLQTAKESERLEDMVPLGALYADICEFDEADRIYRCALQDYRDTSPFPVAWVCSQLGALWGELVPVSQPARAAFWYRRAIDFLPCYVKARVHLAEICIQEGRPEDAEILLIPVLSSQDPEVNWRLADTLVAMDRLADAEKQMVAARVGFELLLQKHLLAFADHGAEFYAGRGNDPKRAFELAKINLGNRPTLRAYEQAYETAVGAGELEQAVEIRAADERSRATNSFMMPGLSEIHRYTQGIRR